MGALGTSSSLQSKTLYLNNAATSFPKPRAVIEAVLNDLSSPPKEPGRTVGASDTLASCRERIAALFGVDDPRRVALLPSATHALNIAINGLAAASGEGRFVTTRLEHNSVLRPVDHQRRTGRFSVTIVEPDDLGRLTVDGVSDALDGGATALIVTCASNVTGAVQPVAELAVAAAGAGVPLVLDAAQSGGAIPLSPGELPGRVFVAFAGHKGLLGPAGVGGLIVPDDELHQTIVGGTGVRSEALCHPPELPLRHEAGTPNLPGLAGLEAAIAEVEARGVKALGEHRERLVAQTRSALGEVRGVRLLPLPDGDGRAGIVSLTFARRSPQEVGFVLRESFGIEVRTGLHCAPLVHRDLGTAPAGCIRASFGPFNTERDVERLVAAVEASA